MQKSNAVINAVIDGNVLTVDTFNDLAKYCNNTVISVKSKPAYTERFINLL